MFAGDWLAFAVLAMAGAAAGLLYTLLEPAVRPRPRLRYLPWVLGTYLVIFGGGGVGGLLVHDHDSIDRIRNPWFIGLALIAGAVGGYAAGHACED